MGLDLKGLVKMGMGLAFDLAEQIVVPFDYKQFDNPQYAPATGVVTPNLSTRNLGGILLSFKQSEIDGEVVKVGDEKIIVLREQLTGNGSWYYWIGDVDNSFLPAASLAEAVALGTPLVGDQGNDIVYATPQGLADYLANVDVIGSQWFDVFENHSTGRWSYIPAGHVNLGPVSDTAAGAVAIANASGQNWTTVPLVSGKETLAIVSENDFFVDVAGVVRQVRSFSIDPTNTRVIFHVRKYAQ